MPALIGIDGCRAGWVVAEADASLRDISVRIEPALDGVLARAGRGEAIVAIDIPIGLASSGRRAADALARQRLGWPRMTSVFSAPARAALAATSYREACALNAAACGRMMSQQAYHIMPKISAVDALMTPALQTYVREAHPEVAFAEIAGLGHGLVEPKTSREGAAVRRDLLAQHLALPDIDAMYGALGRKNAERDDIIDALVCLVTAQRVARGEARTFPDEPEYDDRGLRMELVA